MVFNGGHWTEKNRTPEDSCIFMCHGQNPNDQLAKLLGENHVGKDPAFSDLIRQSWMVV